MKNKLSKGLSLSVNPKHSISERFKASTHGFCHFWKKFESERNTPFSVILGFIPRIHIKHLANVILGFIPRIHTKHSPLDTRVKPEYDRDLMVDTRVTPEYDNRQRMCFKPEYDHKRSLTKGLDVVCQYAALLERRVQSSTRVRKAQAVTRQTNPIGRSMIEMLGVLAIIGVLSVGGIAGYSKAMMQFKINKTKQQITEIITNVRTLYINQKDFDGLYSRGSSISNEILSNDSTDNAFGNEIAIDSSYLDNAFHITYYALPKEACIALASTDWGTENTTGIKAVIIGQATGFAFVDGPFGKDCTNGDYYDESYYACSGHLPIPTSIAAKYCNSLDPYDRNLSILVGK